MATPAQRTHLASLMDFLVLNEPLIHYLQKRPMVTNRYTEQELADLFKAKKTISMDCSESATLLCRLAGLADPNGSNYDGSGFTGTMLKNLKHYSSAVSADVGALVVFGPGNGDHVCMVRNHGKDPLLFSHGTERGPYFAHLSDVRKVHRAPTTFLSVAKL